jgi:3-dehydroquinate synthase/2-deoxy-scyllo-inosose synthase
MAQPISFVFADRATVPGFLGADIQAEVMAKLLEYKPDKILLLCDETVDSLHSGYFDPLLPKPCAGLGETGASDGLPGAGHPDMPGVEKYILPNGDACKSWTHLSALMEWAFRIGATKKSVVVGFGGGALMNVTGLFASIIYRGLKLVYVPTTLLAMHDVTTSLKTSICYDGRKNNIGSFYAPQCILIDVAFCRTLPRAEMFSGIGELMKNACLFGGKHADGMVRALSKESINSNHGGSGDEFMVDDETLMLLLNLGIEAKMDILAVDAYEKTTGMIFEYGHTVSHAIEKAYGDGVVPHGLGVTYGMMSSSYAAEKMGIMSAEDRKVHDDLCMLLLRRWPLPEPRPSADYVMSLAMRDSKRGLTSEADDEISDVLLRKMGNIVETKTNNLSKFPCSLVREWLLDVGFPADGSSAGKSGTGEA